MWSNLRRQATSLLKAALGPSAPNAAPFASFPECLIAAGWLPIGLLRTDPERAIAIARRRLAAFAAPATPTFTFDDTASGTAVRVVGQITWPGRRSIANRPARRDLAAPAIQADDAGADFDLVDTHGRRLRIIAADCWFVEVSLNEALAARLRVEAVGALDRRVDPEGDARGRNPPLLLLLGAAADAQVVVARASSLAGTAPVVTVP